MIFGCTAHVRATLHFLFLDANSVSSSIDLCKEILFSILEAGPGYKAALMELVAFHYLAVGHFSRVDVFQYVDFTEVSVIVYITISICICRLIMLRGINST